MNTLEQRVYDVIIVGGGSAGCVLAARLSQDQGCEVLLLEAGHDYVAADSLPVELTNSNVPVLKGHNWELSAIRRAGVPPAPEAARRVSLVLELASRHVGSPYSPKPAELKPAFAMPYPMAKVMGGGSAINGGLALHARAEDYDEWAALGNDRWSWSHVEPWVRDFGTAVDGREFPIETPSSSDYTELQRAFLDACSAEGFGQADGSADNRSGVGAIPKNTYGGRKSSMAQIYLDPARTRPNLTIQSNCHVDKLLIDRNGSASAVEGVIDGLPRRYFGKKIVMTAGAIHSPAILQRSGIGAAGELARLGIKPSLDLPGVGRNLVDHASVSLWAIPQPGVAALNEPIHQLMLEQRQSGPDRLDLQLFMLGALDTSQFPGLRALVGADVAMGISVVLATPRSRGQVSVVNNNPFSAPSVCLNCLSHGPDLQRMMQGVRTAWNLLDSPSLRSRTHASVLWSRQLVDSDSRLAEAVLTMVTGAWHPAGTLRMGSSTDQLAVTDQQGRLFGSDNVVVADASIMPTIPGVPTNLSCILIAERIADVIRSGRDF